MTSSRDRRIAKELADIQADRDNTGVYAAPADGVTLKHLKGVIPAPPDTPYAGATYDIDIQIPDNYPFKSPVMRFDTKIWHPNVSSQTGAICLDTLGSGWSPVQTIKTALLSLRMLLESPNPKDPQDAEVASMLVENPERFVLVAQDWAVRYAGAPKQELDLTKWMAKHHKGGVPKVDDEHRYNGYNKDLVDRFVHMGFEVDAVVEAFLYVGIERNDGQDYELEEAYMGDITARLLGEQ
ncbi:Ubiquitin-conjugating enzyme E2 1 [Tolypocladium capitatum]|uniref:Ubiquitin-conjugating enzyme E2 2 n=1 Tax=Tolypocladium capitatum TaxID=45235 RepID=A0A2K3QIS9_9HYPO|nr:Ubiquitin-conjugating enzyme E2 1 [Tolypocladium capitatum]